MVPRTESLANSPLQIPSSLAVLIKNGLNSAWIGDLPEKLGGVQVTMKSTWAMRQSFLLARPVFQDASSSVAVNRTSMENCRLAARSRCQLLPGSGWLAFVCRRSASTKIACVTTGKTSVSAGATWERLV